MNPNTSPKPELPRSLRLVVERRQKKLQLFDELRAAGRSDADAAKIVRVSLTTLWRWRKRIIPQTDRCGRHSILQRFAVTDSLIDRVQKLQAGGKSGTDAWRMIAADPICPADLAAFLRLAEKIPACFIAASRLQQQDAKIITGKTFTQIVPKK